MFFGLLQRQISWFIWRLFKLQFFQASKHLSCGEGGMLTTNNLEFANIARRFTSLGYGGVGASSAKITKDDIQHPSYNRHVSLGFNYRMSELQSNFRSIRKNRRIG